MEGFVCIKKRETLHSLDSAETDVLVLEEEQPFYGYYHRRPEVPEEQYLFLPLNSESSCYEDHILRTAAAMKSETGSDLDAKFAAYTMYHKEFPCMRLKVKDLSMLQAIVNRFRKAGMRFEAKTHVPRFESYVHVKKFAELTELGKNIWQDNESSEFYYLKSPKYLDKEDFSKVVTSVKGSPDYKSFDAAQATFFSGKKIMEFIRLYTKSFEISDLERLQKDLEKQIYLYV